MVAISMNCLKVTIKHLIMIDELQYATIFQQQSTMNHHGSTTNHYKVFPIVQKRYYAYPIENTFKQEPLLNIKF